ncbi:MAG: hypothetical protein ACYDDW_01215 [Dermatophilaceae bacterium]
MPADGDDVAVVPGLGHPGQRRQGLFAFAGGQVVLDLAELTQRGHRLAHGHGAA